MGHIAHRAQPECAWSCSSVITPVSLGVAQRGLKIAFRRGGKNNGSQPARIRWLGCVKFAAGVEWHKRD